MDNNTLSDSNVVCVLCNAFINVRMGNFYKFQLHIENYHDVFKHQDLIMSLSFLNMEEKEVIIEKTLPRMKEILDMAMMMTEKKSLNSPFMIHKRLSDYEELLSLSHNSGSTLQPDQHIPNELMKEVMNDDKELSEEHVDDVKPINQNESITIDSNVNHNQSDTKDNLTSNKHHESKELEKSQTKDKHLSSGSGVKKDLRTNKPPPHMLKCPVCNTMIRKYKYNVHKNNCLLAKMKLLKQKPESQELAKNDDVLSKSKTTEEQNKSQTSKEPLKKLLDCYYCDKQFKHRSNLQKHKAFAHIGQ